MAETAGLAVQTISGRINTPDMPWPTKIVAESSKRDARVQEAAQAKLSEWLRHVDGPGRQWCRETHPRLVAACALIAGSEAAAGAEDMPPPLSAASAAEAVGADPLMVQAAMEKKLASLLP